MSDPTVTTPAEAARLTLDFDAERIVRELTAVRSHTWGRQRVYDDQGVGAETEVDWRCLALRSPGGDPDRTDPGGPSEHDFADTPWLDALPYIREVLAAIPAPLHAVRLMALGPDTVGIDHTDPKYSPHWGVARLHIPVETNPGAILVLDGKEFCWQPGEFWFGDFSRTHRVQNTGEGVRTHLVIDVLVSPGLSTVFPPEWRDYFTSDDVLLNRQPCPQSPGEAAEVRADFDVPARFLLWEEDVDLLGEDTDQTVSVSTVSNGGDVSLVLPDGRSRRLVHLGSREYRFAGWSEERTLQIFPDSIAPSVVLRVRAGNKVQELVAPLQAKAA